MRHMHTAVYNDINKLENLPPTPTSQTLLQATGWSRGTTGYSKLAIPDICSALVWSGLVWSGLG